jgi:drug/metabolite transporter (DMT)-like permease
MVIAVIPFAGEIAGLGTASCWATCALAFAAASKRIGATAVNQLRMPVAIVVLGAAHLIVFGELWPSAATSGQVFWLTVSGLVGIALGDLFLFHSLVLIGPRLGELVMTAAPVVTALLAWPILGESLGATVVLGIAVTMAGVTMVLADRRGNDAWPSPTRHKAKGVAAGLLGAAGQGTGLVLAKLGMGAAGGAAFAAADGGPVGVAPLDPLSATLLRIMAGALGAWVIAGLRGRLGRTFRVVRYRREFPTICLATVLGLLGVWLSLISVTHTKAGIGATLMGISPILILPLANRAYGDRPGRAALAGTFVAVLGVSCLFLAR